MKTFEQVYRDMDQAYTKYLKSQDEDCLWNLCHQVLSNALFILNEDDVEDEFTYEFPADILANKTGVIARLLNTNVGVITKVSTIPCEGIVWFTADDGQLYDDDSPSIPVWEIYNIATALYKMTEPLAELLYR